MNLKVLIKFVLKNYWWLSIAVEKGYKLIEPKFKKAYEYVKKIKFPFINKSKK